MITLTEPDVRRLLDPARLISALEAAFRDRYPAVVVPLRTQIETVGGTFLIMPCYDRAGHTLGMKLVTVREKAVGGDGRVHAGYLLIDPESGEIKMLAAAKHLTAIRTAATSALATKYLAREDARVLGVIGTSTQAQSHLQIVRLVRRFGRFLVAGRTRERTQEFARAMSEELGAGVEAVDAAECAAQADVLCTCTNAGTPLFDGTVIRPGTHINSIGAFQPHAREVDSLTVQRARVVVESYEAALAEPGDLLIPIGEGVITGEHIVADLHELVAGAKAVRLASEDVTLFKSVGNALEDLVAAEMLAAALG
jgi:ornithine cyclodeaminase/alanine dehydrogenase-like protein (mu-crystallin family)